MSRCRFGDGDKALYSLSRFMCWGGSIRLEIDGELLALPRFDGRGGVEDLSTCCDGVGGKERGWTVDERTGS